MPPLKNDLCPFREISQTFCFLPEQIPCFLDTVCAEMIASFIRPAVTYVILLRALRENDPPKSQICNSVRPCSRHRKLHISETISDRGQISEKKCKIFENEIPTIFSEYVIFFGAN